jgi:hypothetical protein
LGENRKFRTGLRRVSAIAVLFSHRQKLLERDTGRPFAVRLGDPNPGRVA